MKQRLLLILGFIFLTLFAFSQKPRNHPLVAENIKCLKCHGQTAYTVHSSDGRKQTKRPMSPACMISPLGYSNAIHGSLKCLDCHAEGYNTFPHNVDLKFESIYACTDCHEDTKKFKRFHLDSIVAGYENSVHAKAMSKTFTCWKCHNPHTYITAFSEQTDLKSAIDVSNAICLDCHNNAEKYKLLTDKPMDNLVKEHAWLSHPEIHLKNVRCVDCHAKLSSGTFTPHEILPSHDAVRKCTACHSQQSILANSLLRTDQKEKQLGFSNSKALQYAFIMGANRNIWLNLISGSLFALLLSGLFIHFFFTLRYRKHHKNG